MLEVGSVTGASLYVSTRETATRVCAGLLVGIATLVAATGGVQAYGFLIGVPVAAVLLLMVETIARYWHEGEASTGTAEQVEEPGQAPVHVDAERPALVALPRTGTDDDETVSVPTAVPARGGPARKRYSDDEVLAGLRAQLADPDRKDPTVESAVADFSMGRTRAVPLVRQAKEGR